MFSVLCAAVDIFNDGWNVTLDLITEQAAALANLSA
jgi:hypothetical protein